MKLGDAMKSSVPPEVQSITAYRCTRCDVEGMLDVTIVCWSCGSTDMLRHASPFQLSNSSQREGMRACEPLVIPSRIWNALSADSIDGA